MEMSPEERRAVQALYRATDYMLGRSPELPVTVLKTFLGVIRYADRPKHEEQMTVFNLSEKLGIPASTVSRHLRYLGERERTGVDGMGLVELREYIHDRRYKSVHLTEKGRQAARRLMTEMNEGLTL